MQRPSLQVEHSGCVVIVDCIMQLCFGCVGGDVILYSLIAVHTLLTISLER